jgi:putative nucleotidyltransferase with HDIG domain
VRHEAGGKGADVVVVGAAPGVVATLRTMLAGSGGVNDVLEVPTVDAAVDEDRGRVALLDVRSVADDVEGAVRALCDGDRAVVAMADDADPAVVRRALDAGALSYLLTWADVRQVHTTVAAAVDGRGVVDVAVVRPVIDVFGSLYDDARRRNRAVIESLAAAVEAKDTVTSSHLQAVTRLARQLARQIDPDLAMSDDFIFGCLLHDVGKIGVPGQILMKPGPLTTAEWDVMRLHPETGARIVQPLGLSQTVLEVVRHHHERWDGAGYPDGLGEDEIPLVARIFSVCDALEAMTARRPYRMPMPPLVALGRVYDERGRQFDPEVVDALERGVAAGEVELVTA